MLANSMVLPATPEDALLQVIDPGLSLLFPNMPKMHTGQARHMILTIFMQESGLRTRVQDNNGPAHGLGQFEEGGGVKGVLTHPASRQMALACCTARGVAPTPNDVWIELARDDLLAVAFARLLLYTDPAPLPPMGRDEEAFDYYRRNWRPGAWERGTPEQRNKLLANWKIKYARAMRAIEGTP